MGLHGEYCRGSSLGPVYGVVEHRDPATEIHPVGHDRPFGSVHTGRLDSVHAVVGPVETKTVVVNGKVQGAGDVGGVDLCSIGHARDADSLDRLAASIRPVEPPVAIAIWSDM